MTQFTEEEKAIRRIERWFSKGVVQYGLIEEGDKILIGLSGGKDSLALVELLGKRARIYKPRFSVVAVHVVMKNIPYQSDTEYLKAHCEAYGVPFVQYGRLLLILLPIHVNLPASFAHGTAGKPCSLLPRSTDAIKSLSVTTWMIFWKLY